MPQKSKRQSHSSSAIKQRWGKNDYSSGDDSSYSIGTSDEEELDRNYLNFKEKFQFDDLGDIFEFCMDQCHIRYLSVLLYLTLRHFNISYETIAIFLKDIGGLTAEVAHKWSNVFIDGNFDEFICEGRGGKHGDSFYDIYPELEGEAKAFAVAQCQQKAPSFTAYDLALFIDKKFYEISNLNKSDDELVRSVRSCRLDLKRWGARYEANANRPFFEGHERVDVQAHRQQFIHHFLNNKDNYYIVSPGENPYWNAPKTPTRTILICKSKSETNFYKILISLIIRRS
jgi:hypothetical protein